MTNNKVTEILNVLLADEIVLYNKIRNYHWNVEGPHFYYLHKFFESLYEEISSISDDIAERIRYYDVPTQATLTFYLQNSRIEEKEGTLSAQDMLKDLSQTYSLIIKNLENDIDKIQKLSDIASEDFCISILQKHQKDLWMINSLLK